MVFSTNIVQNSEQNEPTVLSVASEYVLQPRGVQNLVIEPALKAFSWAKWYEYPLSETSQTVHWFFLRMNHLLDWEAFPGKLISSIDTSFNLADTAFLGSLGDLPGRIKSAYLSFLSIIGLVADGVKVGEKDQLLALSEFHHKILSVIGVLGSVALIVQAIDGLKKQVHILSTTEMGEPKHNLAMIRAISKICLIVLGCFGIAAFASIELAATVVLLVISTLLLLLSLLAHFYEKIHKLDQKNSSANSVAK